ncbi:MAG: ATP-binding protein [Pirellula sp.]
MIDQAELLLLGFATIMDAVLFLIVLERINASQVAIWLKTLIGATFATHAASFARELQVGSGTVEINVVDRICFLIIAIGLLLLPSAMLHAAIRLNHTGTDARPRVDWRYALLYAPFMSLPLVVWLTVSSDGQGFLGVYSVMLWPYMGWLLIANGLSIVLFLRVRHLSRAASTETYFAWHCTFLIVMTLLSWIYVRFSQASPAEPALRILTILSPMAPLLLFVWYSRRTRLLSLVMERTVVYGAIFVGGFFLYRATIEPFLKRLNARFEFDLVSIEIATLMAIVMAWKPLRIRVLESLRYLLSKNVFQVRDATRQLSVQLSKIGLLAPDDLIKKFQTEVEHAIAVHHCRIEIAGFTELGPLAPGETKPNATCQDRDDSMEIIRSAMAVDDNGIIAREWGLKSHIASAMERRDVMWVFKLSSGSIQGLVLLGPRLRCDRLADEQLSALSLLFEQFAVMLDNRVLDSQRLRAERIAMQQDKLSTLGLMAGSLAHEIRNPLSSIKTIATVAMEESALDTHAHKDLEMILSEIDRLSATTQRLLDFARPTEISRIATNTSAVADDIIERILYLLRHLAQSGSVKLESSLNSPGACVASGDSVLSEIFFNLIRNAIEAAQQVELGTVTVRSNLQGEWILVQVADNGPGINSTIGRSMYQPFVTDKETGTGLGLYVANERVKELGGRLRCESTVGHGTIFTVELPVVPHRT